jgi:hypothetical protein
VVDGRCIGLGTWRFLLKSAQDVRRLGEPFPEQQELLISYAPVRRPLSFVEAGL